MKFLMASILSALLAASLGPVQSRQAGDQSDISAEEYAIYAVVIGWMFADDKGSWSKGKMLVIGDQTVRDDFESTVWEDDGKRLKKEFSSIISQETVDDYVAKNAKSHQLTKSLDLKLKYTLVPKEIEEIFKIRPVRWDEFYRQFPNSTGYIKLSRAGLNSSGDQGIVYAHHLCGGSCGAGHLLSLVKKNRKWVVQKKLMTWVS